ncbi:MAG TPA: dienelactone hydrolase family protein [Nitrospirota bacterium]|nr:dienelactone hydrolase family protein [Nitrospirota bacterium]
MKRFTIVLAGAVVLVLLIGQVTAHAKIIAKTVEYNAAGSVMKGYLAYDSSMKSKGPGILVVDEWWGLTDNGRRRARMLAELGYTALVADMYGEGKQAGNPTEAAAMSSEVMNNFGVARARFSAAEDLLKKQPTVDDARIAAIGFCFGGGVILNVARQGTDLKGVVSFHGSLGAVEPAGPAGIKTKILVLQGGADKFVTPDKVEEFKKEMNAAGADYRVIVYPGATHAFTNPRATALGKKFNLPIAYNEKADKESWQAMKTFFGEILK